MALEVGRKIAGADAGAGSDEDLCTAAVVLAQLQSLVCAGQAHVCGELDARGVCDQLFGLSPGSWLARDAALPVERPVSSPVPGAVEDPDRGSQAPPSASRPRRSAPDGPVRPGPGRRATGPVGPVGRDRITVGRHEDRA
jgi:hypothetical protein